MISAHPSMIGLHKNQQPLEPCRIGRMIRQPDRYLGIWESFDSLSHNQQFDPFIYKEAMEDADRDSWQKAMESEIKSMYTNQIWNLVDLPKWIKPIWCKWVYTRKRGVDRKVETLKARLVAKRYTQREWIEYEETFFSYCYDKVN